MKGVTIVLFFIVIVAIILLIVYPSEINQGEIEKNMKITSPAFQEGGNIPDKYSCIGEDINPELEVTDVPDNAKSLVLIVDDPDAAPVAGKVWDHWIVYGIHPTAGTIVENSFPTASHQGKNGAGKNEYQGPCPPEGQTHNYHFKVYALDIMLDLEDGSTKSEVEKAMEGHIIEQTALIGRYTKP
jgi:Raf kinase inhibitor-like YbhB/YbcL family protein